MSCRYACTCGGACWSCSSRESERYFGEAEDLRAQELGYASYEDHMRGTPQQDDTRQEQEEEPQFIAQQRKARNFA